MTDSDLNVSECPVCGTYLVAMSKTRAIMHLMDCGGSVGSSPTARTNSTNTSWTDSSNTDSFRYDPRED